MFVVTASFQTGHCHQQYVREFLLLHLLVSTWNYLFHLKSVIDVKLKNYDMNSQIAMKGVFGKFRGRDCILCVSVEGFGAQWNLWNMCVGWVFSVTICCPGPISDVISLAVLINNGMPIVLYLCCISQIPRINPWMIRFLPLLVLLQRKRTCCARHNLTRDTIVSVYVLMSREGRVFFGDVWWNRWKRSSQL